jgi:Caspase domain
MRFSHGHALLIGVGSYAALPRWDVPMTAADAQAVAAALRDPALCGYPAEQVTLLTDRAATRDGILAALDALAARAGVDDTIVLFFSGHGHYDDHGGYCLTTHDTRLTASRMVADGTAVSQVALIEKLRALRAARVLCLFNACHAGAISPVLGDEEPLPGVNPPAQTSAALLATGAGRVVISACREHQYAFVGDGPLTIFTQALVEGLRGDGVTSRSGYISLFDLYTGLYSAVDEMVRRVVPAELRQRYGQTQEPELTIIKGVGPFAIALYQGAAPTGNFEAPEQPAARAALRELSRDEAHAALQIVVGRDLLQAGHDAVSTSGGDYVGQGTIDRRSGTFVGGDQYNLSGQFHEQVNIRSTVTSVAADAHTYDPRAELLRMVAELKRELQGAPAQLLSEAEAVAELADDLVAKVSRERPNRTTLQIGAAGLAQAAQNLAGALPAMPRLAAQIATLVGQLAQS